MQNNTDSTALLEQLGRLHPKLIDLSLGRIERLLQSLGNPHKHLPPVIHIAGTNGKGSVLTFLKACLQAAGLKVHAYTSPHLVRFHERIVVAGSEIPEPALVDVLTRCREANAGEPITFFEITNAAAFLAFAETKADVALVEVGLGGRFDSTNVLDSPALTIITPIGMDHTDYLGETLAEIASAKAGIIKRQTRVVVAEQEPDALRVIEKSAIQAQAPMTLAGRDFSVHEEHGRMIYEDGHGLLDLPKPALLGHHQMENAALAIATLRARETPKHLAVDERHIAKGIADAKWPARMQRLTHGPLVDSLPPGADLWLDAAHNEHGARAVAETLAELNERGPRPLYMICGLLQNRDATAYFSAFSGLARRVFCIPVQNHASHTPGTLFDAATKAGLNARPAPTIEDAMDYIGESVLLECSDSEPPRILICGSLYLAGEVLAQNG